jgi:hypothetical protein
MRDRIATWTLLLLLPLYWLGAEVWYAFSRRPVGVRNASDWLARFGDPECVHVMTRDEICHYEVRGALPPPWAAAFPSDRPSYVFDGTGRFLDWCSDPGDAKVFRNRWPFKQGSTMDPSEFRRRFSR